MLALTMTASVFSAVSVNAAVKEEDEIPVQISAVKSIYTPGETYFVSNSTQKWVGEDNIEGDKTLKCFAPGTTNSHGRFAGLWESMGFASYVFYNVFGEMPQIGYHCNPNEINDKVEIIGRYATSCRYLKGRNDGDPTEENIRKLLSEAKVGDVLVVAPEKTCKVTGRAMVITGITDAYITVYHADYKGGCAVTEDTISYDALDDFHILTLLRSADYPYPQPVPPEKVEKITLSSKDFSLNENVNITWPIVKYAKEYKVYLVDEYDNVIQDGSFKGSVTSFVFKNPGKFRIKVIAGNEYGDSAATYSDEIVVHNRNVVTFKDYDGTVITTQTVEYGENAIAPNVPQRKGYQFAGWDKSLNNIIAPTEITATYEIEKYTIKYYDVGGKKALYTETVEYQGKANPPENYTISEGYVFAGWQISYDSIGTDYNCVDGNMTLIASQKWENLNLPITISIANPLRNDDGKRYTANITVKNNDTSAGRKAKIIGTLKSAEGKALKIVVLYELSLKAGESVTKPVEIVYSEKATTIEFSAVGMVDNSKTGGAFSKTASAKILDNTSWGKWGGWTTEDLRSSYDAYETKTQYRYRNKTYTTSTSSSLSGWTRYDKTSSTGSWSSWSKTAVSASTTDKKKREVQTRYIEPTYKTQYHYYHYCKGSASIWTHASSGGTFHDLWVDATLPYYKYSGGMNWYKGAACSTRSCPYWFICDGSTYGGPGPWTRQVQTGGGYTEYRYRDTKYTYHYWQWGSWSSWSDTSKSGDETATRTMYRYRNRSDSGEAEDNSGEFFNVNGTISNVEKDFKGQVASVMIYKRCNTDPTEEQLEYIGQTTIGEGNTYSFSFKPKEMPSSETGEFIVALGIEGADRLVNVDVIEADAPTYHVQFVVDGNAIEDPNAQDITDSDGKTFKAQVVREGETAIAPEVPEKEGYTFVKWSETLTGINTNKIITAEYKPNEYSLVFIDWENNKVTTEKMKYGDTIVYPVLEAVVGAEHRTWDKQLEGIEFVTDNMIIGSVADLNEYSVTFMVDDEVVSTQTVKHGYKAELPDQTPTVNGMIFAGWVGTCSPDYITQDSIFKPSFIYSKTVAMPEAETISNDDGTSTVTLSCDTEGAEIYYIIESCGADACLMEEPELIGGIWEEGIELMDTSEEPVDSFKAVAKPYTGEITLKDNETITFIAYAEGMNESIPAIEANISEISYYEATITENSLRQYKNSVEGTVVVNLENKVPEYELGTVTLCFYDDKGIMIDMFPSSVDVIPGNNKVVFEGISLTNERIRTADSIRCKVVSWLYGDTITPISDVLEFVVD